MILVTGGERSGKSDFAVKMAIKKSTRAFIATAEPFDDEMRSRIEKHRKDRKDLFDTFEEPLHLSETLKMTKNYDVCVIDCMTTWVGNLMYHDVDSKAETEKFLANLNGNEIIVSNEVGMGIISVDKMTRTYVETLGRLNQEIAKMANEVFFMVAGIPMKIK
jgi:adenosylcobinamide kinase/adenosylcobinamide-phosphate guanylyltransferase